MNFFFGKCLLSTAIFGIFVFHTSQLGAEEPKKTGLSLFQEHCIVCHTGRGNHKERVAPPMFAVKNHYIPTYGNRDDFIDAVVRWVRTPDEKYSLMPGARMRFGLMPAIEMDEDDLRKIAEFVYDARFDIPGWYAEHYKQEHGKYPETGK